MRHVFCSQQAARPGVWGHAGIGIPSPAAVSAVAAAAQRRRRELAAGMRPRAAPRVAPPPAAAVSWGMASASGGAAAQRTPGGEVPAATGAAGGEGDVLGTPLPLDQIAEVRMRVGGEEGQCSAAISFWPTFHFAPPGREAPPGRARLVQGGDVLAEARPPAAAGGGASQQLLHVDFAQQPPDEFRLGARFLGWLPFPFLVLRTTRLEGTIDPATGAVLLLFEAQMLAALGDREPTVLPIRAQLTSEAAAAHGTRVAGERLARGRTVLVSAAEVPKTGRWLADLILLLPAAATARLPMRLEFSGGGEFTAGAPGGTARWRAPPRAFLPFGLSHRQALRGLRSLPSRQRGCVGLRLPERSSSGLAMGEQSSEPDARVEADGADVERGSSSEPEAPAPKGSESPSPPSSACSALAKIGSYALEQWFILGLGAAIAFAAAVPRLGATGGYIRAEYSVKIPAIVLIFIISGLGLKTRALLGAAADMRIHLLVQGLSLGAVPALGYAVALALRSRGFNQHLADGLVIMACMPTTVSTNVVYTARAAGNEAAALVNAVVGNIVGIFVTPLWLGHFLDVQGAAPYSKVLVELAYTIIAPLLLGQLLQYGAPRAVKWVKDHINTANVSSCCILLLVWVTFCNTFANGSTKQVPGADVAATVFLNVALFFLFVAVCFAVAWPPPPLATARRLLRLRKADAVAVVICGSTKTVALGVPLINVMYKSVPYAGLLAMPLIIYHALQVLLGGLMIGPLKTWCLRPERGVGEGGGAGALAAGSKWGLAAWRRGGGGAHAEQQQQQQQQQQEAAGGPGGGAPPEQHRA